VRAIAKRVSVLVVIFGVVFTLGYLLGRGQFDNKLSAAVAKPDAKWGEVPLAFVELKAGAAATAEELIVHCRSLLARYKVPKEIQLRGNTQDTDR